MMYAAFGGAAVMYVLSAVLFFGLRIRESFRAVVYMQRSGHGFRAGSSGKFRITRRCLVIHADIKVLAAAAALLFLSAATVRAGLPDTDCAVSLAMDGIYDTEGNLYCRSDNCGIRISASLPYGETEGLYIGAAIDGREDLVRYADLPAGDDKVMIRYEAFEIAGSLSDGIHEVEVFLTDGDEKRQLPINNFSGDSDSGGAEFVLDTTPPKAELIIASPGARRKERSAVGNRWYFSSDFVSEVRICDAFADASDFLVMRGTVSGAGYDASSVVISEPDTEIAGRTSDGVSVFRDAVTSDCAARYFAYGCDRAGNALVYGDGFEQESAGYHIIRDTVPPRGFVSILAEDRLLYSMDTGGNVLCANVMSCAAEGEIRFLTDTQTERSPVMIQAAAGTSDGRKIFLRSESFRYGEALSALFSGETAVKAVEFRLEDLAGNVSEGPESDCVWFDSAHPAVRVFRTEADAPEGNSKLFRTDVPVRIAVSDAKDKGGTGIGDVICEVRVNGSAKPAEIHVLHRGAKTVFRGKPDEEKRIFEFEDTFTVGSSYDTDDIAVRLNVSDNAGNQTEQEIRFGIDSSPPEIVFDYGGDEAHSGKWFNRDREVLITVRERHFDPGKIRVRVKESDVWPEWENAGADTWRSRIRMSDEGVWTVSAWGQDSLGNAANAVFSGDAPEYFVIDRTKPGVSVSGESTGENYGKKGGGLYFVSAEGAAWIEVTDSWFAGDNTLRIQEPGDDAPKNVEPEAFSDGKLLIRFEREGVYKLSGGVTDLAGNSSDPIDGITWVVDRTAPSISFRGIRSRTSYAEQPDISIAVLDGNPDPESVRVEITGSGGKRKTAGVKTEVTEEGLVCLPGRIADDGYYTLICRASDRAGNRSSAEISFSLNRKGPVLRPIEPGKTGEIRNQPVQVKIGVWDTDPVRVISAKINGTEAPCSMSGGIIRFEEEAAADGKYVVTLTVRDTAGHEKDLDPLEFMVDRTPPVFTLTAERTGPEKGDVRVRLLSDDREAELAEVSLDGKDITELCSFAKGKGEADLSGTGPGKHTVSAKLRDAAGNESENIKTAFSIPGDGPPAVLPAAAVSAAAAAFLLIRRKARKTRKFS